MRSSEKDAASEPSTEPESSDATSSDEPAEAEVAAEEAPAQEEPPALTGYAALVASLREAAVNAEDLEGAIASIEAEFVGMTESVNEARAAAKTQEAIALAAKEQFLRSTADFENFRKRSQAEKDALRDAVKGDVVGGFLPLVDNFELASKNLKLETEGEKRIDASYQGLYRQMVEIFKNLGVTAVNTIGHPFDPEIHEAIMQEPSEDVDDGVILDEFRRGFQIGEKLLRPAMVKVAINDSPKKEAPSAPEGEAPAEAAPESAKESA